MVQVLLMLFLVPGVDIKIDQSGKSCGSSSRAGRASACECTKYVANSLGLPSNYPNAKDWGPYLIKNGYHKVDDPTSPGVIVFQPDAGHGVDTTNGHVGKILAVKNTQGGWAVTVRGAKQGGKIFTDAGCTNISDIVFNIKKTEKKIAYYVK